MANFKHLRQFTNEELLLNGDETRVVLKFIFTTTDHALIDSLPMSDALREFAQGLLVEAIDASYALGFVVALLRSTANPAKGASEILKSFGKKVSKLWFKHATVHDLMDVKVYRFVLDRLAESFRDPLRIDYIAGSRPNQRVGAFLAYQKPAGGILEVWG